MDDLQKIPPKEDTVKTPQEQAIMQQYFNNQLNNNQAQSTNQGVKKVNWKFIGYSSILFLALANPWIDSIISKIPYLKNPMMILLFKLLLFILILVISFFFLM